PPRRQIRRSGRIPPDPGLAYRSGACGPPSKVTLSWFDLSPTELNFIFMLRDLRKNDKSNNTPVNRLKNSYLIVLAGFIMRYLRCFTQANASRIRLGRIPDDGEVPQRDTIGGSGNHLTAQGNRQVLRGVDSRDSHRVRRREAVPPALGIEG